VRSRAASRGVAWVGINQTSRLAAYGEPSGIEGALKRTRAVRPKVDFTSGDVTSNIVIDPRGEVVSINKTDIVVVIAIAGGQSPLGKRGWGDASSGVRITQETAIAATGQARVRAWVGGEVAITTSPDTSGSPVVRDTEGTSGE